MKLSDALAKILKFEGIKNVFGLQGGAVVHLFDSIEKEKINVTYTNHEESAALAATANAKASNNIGCTIVTTGPGCTNAITGLLAAWQDSIPCIIFSGQARKQHVSYGKKVRQVGTQEVNICDIVKPITKYTKFVSNKEKFIYEVLKAIKISKNGRPGPVWIDIPLDLQWANIKFDYRKCKLKLIKKSKNNLNKNIFQKSINIIKKSKRPLMVLGYGVRASKLDGKLINNFSIKNKIPFVCTWNSSDLFATNNTMNLGIIGMSGQRGANKAIFQSDLLICIGSHLSIPQTTTLYKKYAPNAKKIIVNIDANQLKNLNVKFDLKVCCDAKVYFEKLSKVSFDKKHWDQIDILKKMNWYNSKEEKYVNSNNLIYEVTKKIKDKLCVVVDGGGTALYAAHQSSQLKESDRIICSSAISSMGTGLAETIGVTKSKQFKKIICIIGDGSFLMNIQDLQTIAQDKINVAIILINNNGYLAIRHTQKEFLNSRFYGTHPDWKLKMPSFDKVVKSFNLKYKKLVRLKDKNKIIKQIINNKHPTVYEIIIDEDQGSLFKQGYLKKSNGKFEPQPLSEMYPYLNKYIANTNN